MTRFVHSLTAAVLCIGLILTGCGQKKAASSDEAIANAKAMETTQQKVDYLVNQAEAFYESEQYKDAVESAQYVIRNLEKDSKEAREVLEKARKELGSAVEGVVKDLKKGIGDLGK